MDYEPPPPGLPDSLHHKYGFSMYSARYGNIYTVRQLLQLVQEVAGNWKPVDYVWEKDGKFYDALRPSVEAYGFNLKREVIEQREHHISNVNKLFKELDVLIFTLGLTEMWVHKESGTVYPTAPGTIVGKYDSKHYEFKNAEYDEILSDFYNFVEILGKIRNNRSFKIILTVSPVPLTATASGNHVLVSSTYSKSVLRAVAGELSLNHEDIDYFPSYELVTNPRLHSSAFEGNLRSVRNEIVEIVMKHFFIEHPSISNKNKNENLILDKDNSSVACDDILLEDFIK